MSGGGNGTGGKAERCPLGGYPEQCEQRFGSLEHGQVEIIETLKRIEAQVGMLVLRAGGRMQARKRGRKG